VPIKLTFATNVQRVLDHSGLSVNGAANLWAVPQKTLESVVKRLRCPSLETAQAIAKGAGFELWQMLAENFDPSNPPVMQPMTPAEIEFYRLLKNLMAASSAPRP
jgi:hypothetical protein